MTKWRNINENRLRVEKWKSGTLTFPYVLRVEKFRKYFSTFPLYPTTPHIEATEQEPLSLDEEYALALEAQEQGKEN